MIKVSIYQGFLVNLNFYVLKNGTQKWRKYFEIYEEKYRSPQSQREILICYGLGIDRTSR